MLPLELLMLFRYQGMGNGLGVSVGCCEAVQQRQPLLGLDDPLQARLQTIGCPCWA